MTNLKIVKFEKEKMDFKKRIGITKKYLNKMKMITKKYLNKMKILVTNLIKIPI